MKETELWGELRSDHELKETYKIFEKDHRFIRREGLFHRSNEI
jgi:hypothetical protein